MTWSRRQGTISLEDSPEANPVTGARLCISEGGSCGPVLRDMRAVVLLPPQSQEAFSAWFMTDTRVMILVLQRLLQLAKLYVMLAQGFIIPEGTRPAGSERLKGCYNFEIYSKIWATVTDTDFSLSGHTEV